MGPRDADYLAACRPAPATAAQREAILRTLPEQGAVTTLASQEGAKLDTVISVLRFHARDDVYQVKVIDVPQAWTGLHGRAVLLISLPALRLLAAEQLQALVAHEIAHEYWWDEWETARQGSDQGRLRSLEGLCDALAVLTLTGLGIPAERLSSALSAIHDFNRRRVGIAANDANYPTLRERRRIVKRFSGADDRMPPRDPTPPE
jgi:Zn-dependent protease with chaperone function